MEYIKNLKDLVTLFVSEHQEGIDNLRYLAKLFVGENWQVLIGGLLIASIIAYKSCKSISDRQGNKGLFVFLSSVAGCYHFADLMREWLGEKLVIIEDTAIECTGGACLLSFAIIIALGIAYGWAFYAITQMVIAKRRMFLRRRYRLNRLHRLACQQADRYKYY